jgi:hypothetical protein
MRQVWLMLEHQFIGNSEMCALHLDAMFCNFLQGDLSVSDYCMADSLSNLSCMVSDHNVVLNVH